MSTQSKTLLTPEEYLEIERKAEGRHEYYQGEMCAMVGGGANHSTLIVSTLAALDQQLRDRPYEVLICAMRVHAKATGFFGYPDLVVIAGKASLLDKEEDTLLNPAVIVEVLSPSTEAYDRGCKFEHYQTIESLQEYLLVASERVHADLYTRQPDHRWLLTSASRLEDSLDLQSVQCRLTLADLYRKVELTAS